VEWPEQFYAWRAGEGCPSCAEGRPETASVGERYFAGELCDAYLVRADIQRGLTIAVFRGRHVVEPIELEDTEAATYGREVLGIGRAIQEAFAPMKLNYDLLGNSVPHLHTHIVPRYADDPRPGWPFPFPYPARRRWPTTASPPTSRPCAGPSRLEPEHAGRRWGRVRARAG
jgi:diadenosine tetraphosphate (Ap4A) HIT family hydrolase